MNKLQFGFTTFYLLSVLVFTNCSNTGPDESELMLTKSFDLRSDTEVLVAREEILNKYPQSSAAAYIRSWFKIRSGRQEEAFKISDSLVKAEPNFALGYYARANYQNLNNWEGSKDDYNKAIELKPDFIPALLNRGSLFFSKKLFAEAKADFEKIISLNPNHNEALLNLGNVWFSSGDVNEACRFWISATKSGSLKAKEMNETYCK